MFRKGIIGRYHPIEGIIGVSDEPKTLTGRYVFDSIRIIGKVDT